MVAANPEGAAVMEPPAQEPEEYASAAVDPAVVGSAAVESTDQQPTDGQLPVLLHEQLLVQLHEQLPG